MHTVKDKFTRMVQDVLEIDMLDESLSFIELGGVSMDALKISVRAKEMGITITAKDLFYANAFQDILDEHITTKC